MRKPTLLFSAIGLLATCVTVSAADGESVPAPRKDRAKTAVASVTAQQEAEVLQFLREHHPELADVLGHLQRNRPAEYARAVRDIRHAIERLQQVEKGDSERYELELQSWVIQSKIQLLAARLAIRDNPGLHEELRHLLDDQLDLRMGVAQTQRDRVAERLRRVDEQLQRMTDNRSEILERAFLSVTKSSERIKVRRKDLLDAKPAAKKQP